MEKKLTIAHLAPYLPYGLKFKIDSEGYFSDHELTDRNIDLVLEHIRVFNHIKPILLPLSKLTQEIEHNGERFVPIEKLEEIRKGVSIYKPINDDLPLEITIQTEDYTQEVDLYDGYLIMQKLFEWHFDVFGLLDTGLAIEKGAEG